MRMLSITNSLHPRIVQSNYFFFQAEDGIRDYKVTGVQTCALPIYVALVWLVGNGHRQVGVPPGRIDEEAHEVHGEQLVLRGVIGVGGGGIGIAASGGAAIEAAEEGRLARVVRDDAGGGDVQGAERLGQQGGCKEE